jgi:hypothetical protein
MEIDRMWILGRREFIRNGDIYVGITSKPNTIAKLLEFNKERYGKMSWINPAPEEPFPFAEEDVQKAGRLWDLDSSYEPGLFWDMLTDIAWMLRGNDMNPLKDYPRDRLYLTGWSQSACYMFRYLNSFAYRPDVARNNCVFDGYLAGGGVHSFVAPVNQYESAREYDENITKILYSPNPFIAVQTESENGLLGGWQNKVPDSDRPNLLYRLYEVTGSSHDTMSSYIDYYQNDPDLIRINHLPAYIGKHKEGNDYPLDILFAAAYRKLFVWVRTGVSPMHCESIPVDAAGENLKDAFGNTRGGLRTCLLNYPSGRYLNVSDIEIGTYFLDPASDKDRIFGHQEAFSPELLKELYGSLENYRRLVTADTKEQIAKGFINPEDGEDLIRIAIDLAKKRGLRQETAD